MRANSEYATAMAVDAIAGIFQSHRSTPRGRVTIVGPAQNWSGGSQPPADPISFAASGLDAAVAAAGYPALAEIACAASIT